MSELGKLLNETTQPTEASQSSTPSGQVLGETTTTQAQFTVKFLPTTNQFQIEVSNAKQVVYKIEYRATIGESDTITKQGSTGKKEAAANNTVTITQVAGSESGGSLTPHNVKDGLIQLAITDTNDTTTQSTISFEVSNGKLSILETKTENISGQVQGVQAEDTLPRVALPTTQVQAQTTVDPFTDQNASGGLLANFQLSPVMILVLVISLVVAAALAGFTFSRLTTKTQQ